MHNIYLLESKMTKLVFDEHRHLKFGVMDND